MSAHRRPAEHKGLGVIAPREKNQQEGKVAGSKVFAGSNFGIEIAGKQKGTKSGWETWLLGLSRQPAVPRSQGHPTGLEGAAVGLALQPLRQRGTRVPGRKGAAELGRGTQRSPFNHTQGTGEEAGVRGPVCSDPFLPAWAVEGATLPFTAHLPVPAWSLGTPRSSAKVGTSLLQPAWPPRETQLHADAPR